jgi:diaminohydroxyphosphoribosylaminopyrimidine deaminase/5-amino-6-(5-phosphoribosylamino)uracil reductase
MSSARDHELMARALRLAANGRATTAPNPTVGCVLVRDGEIVGEGFTAPAGGPHAEVAALAAAGGRAAGATAYVTLEPCCHYGRTGPCSTALITARVARVVCAVLDPNPRVAGGGAAALRAAGIDVEVGVLAGPAEAMNRGYFARMRRGRPWVRSKLAASLDGRTALANGESRWITGESARRDVHVARARAGAILTGIGTVLRDDPSLTARPPWPGGAPRQPLRAIVDAQLRTPRNAQVLAGPGPAVIFTTEQASRRLRISAGAAASRPLHADAGAAANQAIRTSAEAANPPVQVRRAGADQSVHAGDETAERSFAGARIEVVRGDAHCDLAHVLERLAALEINDVWVEAGAGLNGALLSAGLIDELVLYFAPQILGDTARGLFSLPPLASLAERVELEIDEVRRIGRDLRISARPLPRASGRTPDPDKE